MNTYSLIKAIKKASYLAEVVDITKWKKEYRTAVKLLHPDLCDIDGAEAAMIKLNRLKEVYENGQIITDDAGEYRLKDNVVHFFGDDGLLRASHRNFLTLKRLHDKSALHFQRYLPHFMENGNPLKVHLQHRAVPLKGLQLPQGHVNWILSRLLEVCAWMSQEGYVHGGINPESVLVVPETHGIILTSFYHLKRKDMPLDTISARYQHWYPSEIFNHKRAITTIDLECSKRLAAYLLGDISGSGVRLKKTHNADYIDFLLDAHDNAFQCYDLYRKMLKKNFKRKFLDLKL